ncbi:hypothetical protein O9G_004850 [Rozella allomycis CSF55]|uniref:Uncharacterized protein n=1 Tax=Rozella allomycis (strain CSF55) TaxID=988480 RepID=A0A075B4U4_ROZAC|nr:hypothetical protein O9G_004850 [Rozella allomycis CSF55]|eukprot:EPZ36631.1 hypothetical protein O9G_004850 [Rozella allomycis CSF55]
MAGYKPVNINESVDSIHPSAAFCLFHAFLGLALSSVALYGIIVNYVKLSSIFDEYFVLLWISFGSWCVFMYVCGLFANYKKLSAKYLYTFSLLSRIELIFGSVLIFIILTQMTINQDAICEFIGREYLTSNSIVPDPKMFHVALEACSKEIGAITTFTWIISGLCCVIWGFMVSKTHQFSRIVENYSKILQKASI